MPATHKSKGREAHVCLRRFVEFTRPRKPARARASQFVDALRMDVEGTGVEILGFFHAGSIEKGTGLRRFKSRESDIPGQGADLVLSLGMVPVPTIAATHECLSQLAEGHLAPSRETLERDFRRERLHLGLAPVLDIRGLGQFYIGPDRSILPVNVRQEHEQIKKRTRAAAELNPKVGFNDAVRLLKWWRHARPPLEPVRAPSSIELEHLAIAAFDGVGVCPTWSETLAAWCEWLAHDPPHVRLPAPLGAWFAHGARVFRKVEAMDDPAAIVDALDLELFGSAFSHANR